MTATIIVIGSDEYNLALIRELPGMESAKIQPVLHHDDVQPAHGRIDFDDLYQRAKAGIEEAGGKPDAIIGDLDFPVSSLVSLLCRDFDIPYAKPEAIALCEHKWWMREQQRAAMPDQTPEVRALNPFEPEQARKDAPDFPFWLKPVKGHSSVLGFMIRDASDLDKALHACRQKIHLMGEPFNQFLAHLESDFAPDSVDGNYLVAEEIISAPRQFTLEGYVFNGETTIYGGVDSVRGGALNSSFSRFQYPAELPETVVKKATEQASTFLRRIGFDSAPFNVEFFWDPETDVLNLLEINPRISKSHAPQFRMVDGHSHHKVPIDLCRGREPDMPQGKGKDAIAAKFIVRSFEADGIVERVPSKDEIAALDRILPDIDTKIHVEKGLQLSSLFYQESYSYELADLFLGGESEQMIEDAFARCVDSLHFHIKPLPLAS